MATQLNAYLSFDGKCEEAMRFYADVLGAELAALIRYGEMPGNDCPPGSEQLVMHACVMSKDLVLMAGDAPPGMPYQGVHGCMLTLTYDAVADARRAFERLADGGKIDMPLGETFWADTFGMLHDRYGVPWAVNGGRRPMQ